MGAVADPFALMPARRGLGLPARTLEDDYRESYWTGYVPQPSDESRVWVEGVVFDAVKGELQPAGEFQARSRVGAQGGTYFKTARLHRAEDGQTVSVWRYGRRDLPHDPVCEGVCEECGTGAYLQAQHDRERQRERLLRAPSRHPLRAGQLVRVLAPHGAGGTDYEGVIVSIRPRELDGGELDGQSLVSVRKHGASLYAPPCESYARYVKALER